MTGERNRPCNLRNANIILLHALPLNPLLYPEPVALSPVKKISAISNVATEQRKVSLVVAKIERKNVLIVTALPTKLLATVGLIPRKKPFIPNIRTVHSAATTLWLGNPFSPLLLLGAKT